MVQRERGAYDASATGYGYAVAMAVREHDYVCAYASSRYSPADPYGLGGYARSVPGESVQNIGGGLFAADRP